MLEAAHAGCFARALSEALTEANNICEQLTVLAEVTWHNILVDGWTVTSSHLVIVGKVPQFQREIAARVERAARQVRLC